MSGRVAVVGAGMAGLTAARALADAGQAVTVFDKGRGLGGRLATRRTDWGPVDHGAPGVPADLVDLPGAQAWPGGPICAQVVGVPGMSSLLINLSDQVDVLREIVVGALAPDGPGWALSDPDSGPLGSFDFVIVAIPAPQAAALLAGYLPDMGHAVAQARMDPLWTLILVLPEGAGPPQDAPLPLAAPLSLSIPQSAKPGATGPGGRWAVHADPDWSAKHVDLPKDEAAARMLAALRAQTGTTVQPLLAAGHRWRYARVSRPLGQPFAASPCGRVLAGGDWALGPLATHAAASGRAMAAAVLAALA
jgi:predicted NAD/FAD-dependent oxidoreductase